MLQIVTCFVKSRFMYKCTQSAWEIVEMHVANLKTVQSKVQKINILENAPAAALAWISQI